MVSYTEMKKKAIKRLIFVIFFQISSHTLCRAAVRQADRNLNKYCQKCEDDIASEEQSHHELQNRITRIHFLATGQVCTLNEVLEFTTKATPEEMLVYKQKIATASLMK